MRPIWVGALAVSIGIRIVGGRAAGIAAASATATGARAAPAVGVCWVGHRRLRPAADERLKMALSVGPELHRVVGVILQNTQFVNRRVQAQQAGHDVFVADCRLAR